MKLKPLTLALLLSATLFVSPSIAQDNPESWYAFNFPKKLDQNSPLNIGKLVLDAPAGKHGFVKAVGAEFMFEDGTPIRFWGTNLCFSANFPEKKQAEELAERIAFFGFNAVRLHHMDSTFEPRGIFEDVRPAYKNKQMKITGVLSRKQLDKLDYLIYQLKLRGIYVDMNLLVARHFTEADGVKDAEKLGMAAKPYSMFDSKLIELQKQYAKTLLTHYNPYTKSRYCDDPVIALVEIINESTIFDLAKKKMPDYYQKEIDSLWEAWSKTINQTDIATTNVFYRFLEEKYLTEMISYLREEIKIKTVIGIGSHWNSESRKAQKLCDFVDLHAYLDHPKFPNKSWDMSNFRINNKSALLGNELGIIGYIKTSQFKNKPYTITEWNHCYPNQYAYETPVLLASEAVKNNWGGLFEFAFSHGWKFVPNYNDLHSYFDIIANPQKLILCSIGSYLLNSSQDVNFSVENGVFKLDYSKIIGVSGFIKGKEFTVGDFTIKSDQDGAVFVYSADNLPIKYSKKLILIAVSEVKNKNSGWNGEKFNWGSPPVLLKSMRVTVTSKQKSITLDTAELKQPWTELTF